MGFTRARSLGVLLLLAIAVACGESSGTPDASRSDAAATAPDGGNLGPGAPRLTAAHPGFKQARCLSCHDNVVVILPHDAGYVPTECVACHGFNGAPHKDHAGDPAGNCRDCHAQGAVVSDHLNEFEMPRECAICHVHPESPEGL